MENQTPSFLAKTEARLLLFGGKGGVGKTTLATSTALYWARKDVQRKILIASTDPAHSLSDSFDQPVGNLITPVAGVPNLFALEMDASQRLEEFKHQHEFVLKTIMDRGTFFDTEDIGEFFDLSLPGMDELMAVIEIARIVREKKYSLVILDTAPTGHTLRLLSLPQMMERWLGVLNLMMAKHRFMVSTFGHYRPDETDAFLNFMRADLDLLNSVWRDIATTEFIPVTILEAMSISETGRLLEGLKALQIPVETLVVNRVMMPSDCEFCEGRRIEQETYLQKIHSSFPTLKIVQMPLLPHQVRGQSNLYEVSQSMLDGSLVPASLVSPIYPSIASGNALRQPGKSRQLKQSRMLLFGGKGGVGKTTMATATAIYLASGDDSSLGKKTLLFSTDPAHSLSDSLDQKIGNQITPVEGVEQLFALEMDSTELLQELNQAYVAEINEVFDSFLAGAYNIEFDRQVMQELISLTPPGLDELMALMKIMDLMEAGQFERYVLDLAPTGHALRFLETPIVVRKWFMTFFKLLLKYQGLVSLNLVAELLRQKSKQLRKVQQLLVDPEQCQFITVTIPEEMAVVETKRLLHRLVELSVSCNLLITNMINPENDCQFCSSVRAAQQPYLDEIAAIFPDAAYIPLFPQAVQGRPKLLRVVKSLYGGQYG
jgi:arsenite-transporting ATPase